MTENKQFTVQDLINELEEMIADGKLDEAREYCLDLIEKNPGNFLIYFYLAKIARSMDDEEACIENLKQAFESGCDSPVYLLEIGNMFYQLGYLTLARGVFERGADLFKEAPEFFFNIAATFRDEKKFDDAVDFFLKSKDIKDWFEVNFEIASCFYNSKNIEKGLSYINHAIKLDPDNPIGYACLGSINEILGDKEEALKNFDRAISMNDKLCKLYYSIAGLKKLNEKDDKDFLSKLNVLVKDESLSDENRCYINNALGKFYDDIGQYEKAFNAYVNANFFKAKSMNYQENLKEILTHTKQVFTPDLFSRNMKLESDYPRPIFIVGMPRSGSTLIEQILASHSQIEAAGEVKYLTDVITNMANNQSKNYPDCLPDMTQADLQKYANMYLEKLSDGFDKPKFITNKMPANYANLGLINLLFPDAIIIDAKRHPLDTCLSTFMTDFSENELSYTCDLQQIANYYKEYSDLMEYWSNTLPAKIYECFYEDIVENQEQASRQLIEFCGLDWEDSCIDFHENKNAVYTASKSQVREKIYKTSQYRWKNYEEQLTKIAEFLIDEIDKYRL